MNVSALLIHSRQGLTDTPADIVIKKKEQKDAELDKKIQALRKKNEALMKRYQEIEEDKKRAEQEGMAITSRKPKQEDLTITITKAPNQKRIVSEKWGSGGPPSPGGRGPSEEEVENMFMFGRGKRMQLAVTMDNKPKGKRIVSEKREAACPPSLGARKELSEDDVDHLFTFGRGRRIHIAITMDNKAKVEERRKKLEKKREQLEMGVDEEHSKDGGRSLQKGSSDLTMTMTGRERMEYMRWKKERDQIDRERIARHKNAKGEWRRAWDADKTERMFEGDFTTDAEPGTQNTRRGGKSLRKLNSRFQPSEGRGVGQHTGSSVDSVLRPVPVVSSRARGRDRLTGRARRWDEKEEDKVCLPEEYEVTEALGEYPKGENSDFEELVMLADGSPVAEAQEWHEAENSEDWQEVLGEDLEQEENYGQRETPNVLLRNTLLEEASLVNACVPTPNRNKLSPGNESKLVSNGTVPLPMACDMAERELLARTCDRSMDANATTVASDSGSLLSGLEASATDGGGGEVRVGTAASSEVKQPGHPGCCSPGDTAVSCEDCVENSPKDAAGRMNAKILNVTMTKESKGPLEDRTNSSLLAPSAKCQLSVKGQTSGMPTDGPQCSTGAEAKEQLSAEKLESNKAGDLGMAG
ncbi:coiled-coil domain-containing protein 9B isoform X4 [Latimeria chalumnae]|uniref:coiled-coil domain-containing protein 9B isoform X4 n=1 Tax=Latimeria chalumnae TaxID=7897 RepID=UPI00313D7791